MGIRGMETYLERYNSGACYSVNIKEDLCRYRQDHQKTPVVVVDGMSIMRYVYNFKNLPWITGGQIKEYSEVIENFIKRFQKEGAELVFFFDGPLVMTKRETWVKRRLETLDKVYQILNDLEGGARVQNIGSRNLFLLPANLGFITRYIAKKCGCKVISSVRECDLEIAEYAASHGCMAVLAQDSDFVVFEGPLYYWSMKNFNLDQMTTLSYDRTRLAASLGVTTQHLPLLATLLGNDIVSYEELSAYHRGILDRRSGGFKSSKKWIDFPTLFREVALYIRTLPIGPGLDVELLAVARRVFRDESKVELLRQSILTYDLTAPINQKPARPLSEDENWDKILKLIHDPEFFNSISSTIYGIVVQQAYQCSTCLEDYRLYDLPPSQTVLKPIRERLYGVLLQERPGESRVEEWVMCGPSSLDSADWVSPVPPKVEHPGLLALWTTQTEARWLLLGDILGVDIVRLRDTVPPHLTVPALAFRYLFGSKTSRVLLKPWEVQAVVATAVLVSEYSPATLSHLSVPDRIQDTRQLRLYTLISRSYSTIIFTLNGLGDPLEKEMISPSNYQDGKLFQLKYQQASNHSNIAALCDHRVNVIEKFHAMMSFIFNDIPSN